MDLPSTFENFLFLKFAKKFYFYLLNVSKLCLLLDTLFVNYAKSCDGVKYDKIIETLIEVPDVTHPTTFSGITLQNVAESAKAYIQDPVES